MNPDMLQTKEFLNDVSGTDTYRKLAQIIPSLKDLEDIEKRKNDNLLGEDESKQRRRMIYRDFVRVYRGMRSLLTENHQDDLIDSDLLRYVSQMFESLLYNTERIATLKNITRRYGGVKLWSLKLTAQIFSEKCVYDNYRIFSSDDITCTWAHFLDMSEEKIFDFITLPMYSETDMRKVIYSLCFRAFMAYVFGDDFVVFLRNEQFIGKSSLRYYFDGDLTFLNDKDPSRHYLLKTTSLSHTAIEAINNFSVSLADIRANSNLNLGGLIFVPGYQTSDTLRAELYWKEENKLDIYPLYLADFYELFRIWNKDYCIRFLKERVR